MIFILVKDVIFFNHREHKDSTYSYVTCMLIWNGEMNRKINAHKIFRHTNLV